MATTRQLLTTPEATPDITHYHIVRAEVNSSVDPARVNLIIQKHDASHNPVGPLEAAEYEMPGASRTTIMTLLVDDATAAASLPAGTYSEAAE